LSSSRVVYFTSVVSVACLMLRPRSIILLRSQPYWAKLRSISEGRSSMVIYTPSSPYISLPLVKNCMAKVLLPEPGPPETSTV